MKVNQILLIFITLVLLPCSPIKKLEVMQKCPIFNLKSRVSILSNGLFLPKKDKNIFKLFLDYDFIYNLITPFLPEADTCELSKTKDFSLMFPSAFWVQEKNLFLTVVRVNVNKNRSFLYTSWFDSDWNEVFIEETVGSTSVPGVIPIEIPDWDQENAGPEDPRIFKALKNEIFIAFNMLDHDRNRKMWLYSFKSGWYWPLSISQHNAADHFIEKNWIPLITDTEHLYFIYSHKNLQIIDCTEMNKPCIWIRGKYDTFPNSLRGGTPYMRFRSSDFYVSIGYSHILYKLKDSQCHAYRPTLTIIYVTDRSPFYELIYASEPLDFEGKLFLKPALNVDSAEGIKFCQNARIMMALSIPKWDYGRDIVDITLSINDTAPVAIKASGLTGIVEEVIELYEEQKLPKEDECAEKLAYWYYNIPDFKRRIIDITRLATYQEDLLNGRVLDYF
ncbi:unnamed protein product [Blepharisma stoltei]|uniref:Uncharacterized protein n=1 Tax=Blepharisma stoltei TaxID=1481888 RepID=A0AAU9IP02_9CILI|nr:unnamed protein product [Blepharisma stoltei]